MASIQTERIPGASHFIHSDAPAEFVAAVERSAARGRVTDPRQTVAVDIGIA
jgi:hypothetical protein